MQFPAIALPLGAFFLEGRRMGAIKDAAKGVGAWFVFMLILGAIAHIG